MGENSTSKRKKYIWVLVAVLLVAIIATACGYVSKLKENAPTESENVIELIPEEEAVNQETEPVEESKEVADVQEESAEADKKETVQVEVPKSIKKSGTTYTTVKKEKRLVGEQKAAMEVEDAVRTWSSETSINIFDEYYKGIEGDVTVENDGSDGMNLIAPGTESQYTFWVKNTGAVGISYEVSFDEKSTPYDLPLEVRVKHGEKYILGSENKWEPIKALDKTVHEGRLHVKNYAQYTLEWRWPYEGDDVQDTFFGDEAVNRVLEQEITIHTYGSGYDRPIYEEFTSIVQTGDASNTVLWAILALGAVGALIGVVIWKKRREK